VSIDAFSIKGFKFGIELEHNIQTEAFMQKVKLKRGWTIKYEHCGTEVTSPILQGYKGILELRDCLRRMWRPYEQIALLNCGLHVHVDISTFDLRQLKRLALLNSHFSDVIFDIMSPVRRNNKYTHPNAFTRDQILGCTDLAEYKRLHIHDRYYGMNIHAFYKYKTVEFRYAAGTMDWHTIYSLLSMYLRMVSWAISASNIPTFGPATLANFCEILQIEGGVKKHLTEMVRKHKLQDNRVEYRVSRKKSRRDGEVIVGVR
jgi:hypothetical protein